MFPACTHMSEEVDGEIHFVQTAAHIFSHKVLQHTSSFSTCVYHEEYFTLPKRQINAQEEVVQEELPSSGSDQ